MLREMKTTSDGDGMTPAQESEAPLVPATPTGHAD